MEQRTSLVKALNIYIKKKDNASSLPPVLYLALQRVGLLGLLDLDVICHNRVLVELCAVFQVTSEGLGLFGMAQVDHVHRKGVLSLALLGALLVLDLKG